MRNIFSTKVIIGLLALAIILIPVMAGAQDWKWGSVGMDELDTSSGSPFGGEGLLGVVSVIIQLAFAVAAIVAVAFLIIGGFSYVTAGGNPEAIEMAKTTIVNALIGLLVILVSYLIVQFVMSQIGANPTLPEGATTPGTPPTTPPSTPTTPPTTP